MRTKKVLKWLILLAVLVAAALVAGHWYKEKKSSATVKGLTAAVTRGELRRLVVSTGTIKPQVGASVKVGARVSGRVEKLLVGIGQEVKAGEVVAVIEHKDLMAKLEEAQAELAASEARLRRVSTTGPKEVAGAEAALNEDKAVMDRAALDLKRQTQMRKGDLVAQDALDRAQENFLVAQAQVAASQAQLDRITVRYQHDLQVSKAELSAIRAKLKTAQVNLEYATIKAPISGVVSSVSTQEGETVAASLSAPTFITIVDLARLQVDDFVDEADIGLVKLDQPVTFTVDAYPRKVFKGKVEAIHPSAQIVDDVVYYPAVIQILGDYKGLLKPEMTATVSIVTGVRKDVLLLPADAVRRKGGRSVVYVVENGKMRMQPVRLGWAEETRVQIQAGLQEGQTVLIPKAPALSGQSKKH